MAIRLHWIGGPTFFLEAGPFRLLTDPVFGEGEHAFVMPDHPSTGEAPAKVARLAPLPPFDLVPLDAVVLSHVHSGHLDPAAVTRLREETPIIAPGGHVPDVRARGFSTVLALDWWQRAAFRRGDQSLRILAVPAWHSADPAVSLGLGVVNGYLIEHVTAGERRTVYWTGDTVWFDGLAVIRERAPRVDLLVPHVGAVGQGGPRGRMTLDAEEALRLVALVDPGLVVPVHHHTFSHYVEPIELFRERLASTPYAARVRMIAEGESATLP